MKKIFISAVVTTSILSTYVNADNSLYVGVDMMSSKNRFTLDINYAGSGSVDVDSSAFKLKVGTTSNDGWRFQGYYLRETFDKTLFDATNDTVNEFGLDIIKGFEITPEFSPFIQAGVGLGVMSVEGYNESSMSEVDIKIGIGVMYKIIPELEVLAGVDLQYKKWQDIQVGTSTVSTTEKSTKLYAGINYHF